MKFIIGFVAGLAVGGRLDRGCVGWRDQRQRRPRKQLRRDHEVRRFSGPTVSASLRQRVDEVEQGLAPGLIAHRFGRTIEAVHAAGDHAIDARGDEDRSRG
jgi:hypothetical protein